MKSKRFPPGTTFVFVGKLASMSREQARATVESYGGKCPSGVNADLDYLVVGDEDSPLYGKGDKRQKQLKVESFIESGAPTAILTETDFLALIEEAETSSTQPCCSKQLH